MTEVHARLAAMNVMIWLGGISPIQDALYADKRIIRSIKRTAKRLLPRMATW